LLLLALAAGLAWGCVAPTDSRVVARSSDFVVVSVGANTTLRSLARAYLGDETLSYVIANFNDVSQVRIGQEIVIPLKPVNRAAVYPNGYQVVPILTYHRFVPKGQSCDRLAVSERSFARQLAYLRDNNYSVISFSQLADFVEGKAAIPPKSVVLTIDDGYKSAYDVAYPILRKFGQKATIFVYSEFVGASAGLTWAQMKEMAASKLIDIQPHSKTHSDLTIRLEGENEKAYLERIREEVRHPARAIERNLGLPIHTFSYPYGAEDDAVLDVVEAAGFRLGTTVTRGSNPSFAHPLALRRTQIYCDDDIKTFANRLNVFKKIALK
jgi:peptidoglycan/xylan/chitin deacetylase (PgdA/CDA1 family)